MWNVPLVSGGGGIIPLPGSDRESEASQSSGQRPCWLQSQSAHGEGCRGSSFGGERWRMQRKGGWSQRPVHSALGRIKDKRRILREGAGTPETSPNGRLGAHITLSLLRDGNAATTRVLSAGLTWVLGRRLSLALPQPPLLHNNALGSLEPRDFPAA